jgi:hypothetical protein
MRSTKFCKLYEAFFWEPDRRPAGKEVTAVYGTGKFITVHSRSREELLARSQNSSCRIIPCRLFATAYSVYWQPRPLPNPQCVDASLLVTAELFSMNKSEREGGTPTSHSGCPGLKSRPKIGYEVFTDFCWFLHVKVWRWQKPVGDRPLPSTSF